MIGSHIDILFRVLVFDTKFLPLLHTVEEYYNCEVGVTYVCLNVCTVPSLRNILVCLGDNYSPQMIKGFVPFS